MLCVLERQKNIWACFILFYFIEQYVRVFSECHFERWHSVYYFNRTWSNRSMQFSSYLDHSCCGICLSFDLFDCSRKKIMAQCMCHPNNIAPVCCCSAVRSKMSLTAASGNYLPIPHPFSPHLPRSNFHFCSILNKFCNAKHDWADELKAEVCL